MCLENYYSNIYILLCNLPRSVSLEWNGLQIKMLQMTNTKRVITQNPFLCENSRESEQNFIKYSTDFHNIITVKVAAHKKNFQHIFRVYFVHECWWNSRCCAMCVLELCLHITFAISAPKSDLYRKSHIELRHWHEGNILRMKLNSDSCYYKL